MKSWNAPVVNELDVRMTENGFFDACIETCVLWEKEEKKEETPDQNS